MEPTTDPGPDPIAFTRARLLEIADVWTAFGKRKLALYMDKVPAPLAKYLKARTGLDSSPTGESPAATG